MTPRYRQKWNIETILKNIFKYTLKNAQAPSTHQKCTKTEKYPWYPLTSSRPEVVATIWVERRRRRGERGDRRRIGEVEERQGSGRQASAGRAGNLDILNHK